MIQAVGVALPLLFRRSQPQGAAAEATGPPATKPRKRRLTPRTRSATPRKKESINHINKFQKLGVEVEFGQGFANEIRRRLPRAGDKWHLDEAVIKIAGATHWLWRAVDQHGGCFASS